jgi:hypothetical protein
MPQRAQHWVAIKIAAAEAGRSEERRLQREYSLHLESEGRPDGAVIYWRGEKDGGRVYYFSPQAAMIAGALLERFSPRPISPDNMQDLRARGISVANWRHSYVHPR